MLHVKNGNGLTRTGNYTFDGSYDKAIVILWGASRDNNVSLSYSLKNGTVLYDNTSSTYGDAWTKCRIVIISNITSSTYISYNMQYQPGIYIFGIN